MKATTAGTPVHIWGVMLALAVLLAAPGAALAESGPGLAVVDMTRVLAECQAGKEAAKSLSGLQAKLKGEGEALEQEIRQRLEQSKAADKRAAKKSRAKDQAPYSPEDDAKLILEARKNFTAIMSRERDRLMQTLEKNLAEVLEKYRADNGLALILDSSQVLAASPAMDVTDEIIRLMNKFKIKLPALAVRESGNLIPGPADEGAGEKEAANASKPETVNATKAETAKAEKPETAKTEKPEAAKAEKPEAAKPEKADAAKVETPAPAKPEAVNATKPGTAAAKPEAVNATKAEANATKAEAANATKPEVAAPAKDSAQGIETIEGVVKRGQTAEGLFRKHMSTEEILALVHACEKLYSLSNLNVGQGYKIHKKDGKVVGFEYMITDQIVLQAEKDGQGFKAVRKKAE